MNLTSKMEDIEYKNYVPFVQQVIIPQLIILGACKATRNPVFFVAHSLRSAHLSGQVQIRHRRWRDQIQMLTYGIVPKV